MNAGERVRACFEKATRPEGGVQSGVTTATVWAQVFGLQNEPDPQRAVTPYLLALHAEVEAIERSLIAQGAVTPMLQPCFKRLRQATEPSRLGAEWKGFVNNLLAPEVQCTLAWVAWARERVLSHAEPEMDPENIAALLAEADVLETHANAEGVWPFVREMLLHAARTIRNALRLYQVQGITAVAKAVQEVATSVQLHEPELRDQQTATPETKKAWAKFKDYFDRTAAAADKAEKIGKGIERGLSVWERAKAIVSNAWEVIDKLPAPPGGPPSLPGA